MNPDNFYSLAQLGDYFKGNRRTKTSLVLLYIFLPLHRRLFLQISETHQHPPQKVQDDKPRRSFVPVSN